ncbi:MAG: carbohydrate kinase family protein [Chloroflexota bacterium]
MAADRSLDLITIDKSWVDLTLQVPALPQHDRKVVGRQLGRRAGGMGGNVACAASRLGLRTGVASWTGDDAGGHLILESLEQFGVDATHLSVEAGAVTNYTVILLDPSGEKAIVLVPTTRDVLVMDDPLRRYLRQAQIVYVAPYDLQQTAQVADVVHQARGLVACDLEATAGLSDEQIAQLLPVVDILFTPGSAADLAGLEGEARRWAARGPRLVAVTGGAVGAAVCYEGQCHSAASFEVPVVDTTGAGDCFTGAFLAAFLRDIPLKGALIYAQAAAAITIQTYGVRAAVPDDTQIQAFLDAHTSSEAPGA